jgi:hypothetical protein
MFSKKSLFLFAAGLLLTFMTMTMTPPVFSQGMQHIVLPASAVFEGGFDNICYNNGEGELIGDLTGRVRISQKQTANGFVYHVNGANVSGTGLTSGDVYQINGGIQAVAANNGATFTLIHNTQVVSNNQANSFQWHVRQHVTIAPDGQLIVHREIDEINCGSS